MGLFKRKEKCKFHEWKMSDFRIDITPHDVDRIFEITCLKCNKSRIISEYTFVEMGRLGLITE